MPRQTTEHGDPGLVGGVEQGELPRVTVGARLYGGSWACSSYRAGCDVGATGDHQAVEPLTTARAASAYGSVGGRSSGMPPAAVIDCAYSDGSRSALWSHAPHRAALAVGAQANDREGDMLRAG